MSLPTYTFDPTIPARQNNPSSDQPIIQTNAQADFNIWQVDHIGFNVPGSGYHSQVRMPAHAVPSVVAGFGGLYCNTANSIGASNETNLFYTPDATGNLYQLTRTVTGNYATFKTNTSYSTKLTGGWTFLPGGMLFQYGYFFIKDTTTVIFPVPFTNIPYSIQLTVGNIGAGIAVVVDSGTETMSQFQVLSSNSSSSLYVYWTAIGV